jgi:hypothetical protein
MCEREKKVVARKRESQKSGARKYEHEKLGDRKFERGKLGAWERNGERAKLCLPKKSAKAQTWEGSSQLCKSESPRTQKSGRLSLAESLLAGLRNSVCSVSYCSCLNPKCVCDIPPLSGPQN